jgi:NAD(P)-dependent dehydrogenase (short-subunit alcohol dehydrogenase family)
MSLLGTIETDRREDAMNDEVSQLFDLTGRVAIVTGATKGLGRSIGAGLAGAGASVAIVSRDQEACTQVAAEISDATGRPTIGLACHMGEWDALPVLVERVSDHFGQIDVLVNNAGINPVPMSVVELTSEYLDKLFQVNLKGPVRLAGLVAPIMAERGKGSIVNVATVGAYSGGPNFGAYTSVKAGLLNFTKVMAKEWAAMGIRVNTLSPGPFNSTMMQGSAIDPSFRDTAGGATLQRRVAECDEIIGAAVYLASDASSFVTGEDHVVAGGMSRG